MEGSLKRPSQLTGVCRACLMSCPNSKCLLDDDQETTELITRFQAVAQVEVILNDEFPSYICSDCEGKTNEAFKFQETCKSSDEFVRTILGLKESEPPDSENEVNEEPIKDTKDKNEKKPACFPCTTCNQLFTNDRFLQKHLLSHKQENKRRKSFSKRSPRKIKKPKSEPESDWSQDEAAELLEVKRESSYEEEDNDDDEDYFEETPKKSRTTPAKSSAKVGQQSKPGRKVVSGIKLEQFAKEKVDSMIETVKNRMEEAKACRFCDFTSVNPRSLCFHMSMVHKNHRANWCWMCNEKWDNLEEHSQTHRKDMECPFCQRVSKNNTSLISHLSRHSASISLRCKPCDVSFERQELLDKHNAEMHPTKLGPAARHVKEMRLKKRLEAGLRQKSRVAQFPKEQVDAEIKKIEDKMNSPADCPLCPFSAANRSTLGTHMAGTHKRHKDKWCYFCNLTDIDNLKEHKEKEHSREYACAFCNKNLSCGVTRLIEHLLRHSASKSFKCLHCEKTFINEKYMQKHQKLHDEVKSLATTNQENDYSSDDDVKLSELSHGGNGKDLENLNNGDVKVEINEIQMGGAADEPQKKTRFCKQCSKNVSCLETHVKLVHSDEPEASHLCPDCGKTFASKSNLNAHMKLHSDIRPHKCSFCGKLFHIFASLRIHMRKHTKEKPYICNVCGKGFSRSGQLSTHMRIHTGKPHPCDICEKRFCRPSELRVHMRTHTGETPYVCDVCGKGFTHTSNMYNHRRTHFGERPYQCRYCDKTFSQTDGRKAHEFIHTGVKPFKCSICTFGCIKSYDLTKHMMSHDSDLPMLDKPYSCEVCTKRFQTKAHLFSHFDIYHQSSQYQPSHESE